MRPARSECWGAGLSLAGPGRCLQITNERDSGGGGASDWSRAIMWQASWSLIGREEEEPGICACALAHCLVLIAARPLSLTSPANEDTSPGQLQPQQTISTDSSDTRIANINSLVFPEFTQIRREVLMKSNKVESTSRLKILESTLHTGYFKYEYIQFYLNARLKCWLIKQQ